jgi:hypothetical protein
MRIFNKIAVTCANVYFSLAYTFYCNIYGYFSMKYHSNAITISAHCGIHMKLLRLTLKKYIIF